MVYLIVFKLREESIPYVKKALLHLHPLKAYHLLHFFSQEDIPVLVSETGSRVFDLQYIRNILQHDFTHCIQILHDEVRNYHMEKKRGKLSLTKPMDVGVLKHQRKPLPPVPSTPEYQLSNLKPAEVPSSTYTPPQDRERLQEIHAANRERALKLFQCAQERAFKCAEVKTRRLPAKMELIQERTAPPVGAIKYQIVKKLSVPVKTNTTTVLREAAKFIKDEEAVIKRLEAMSTGACNLDMYDNLLAALQQEREQETLAAIEKKHLKGLLSHEEAILSRQQLLQANKERRERFRREEEEWNLKLEELRAQEEQKMKELSEKCQSIRTGARDARKTLQSQKQKIVQTVTEESKEMLQNALKVREEELSRRIQLIKEIRALQAVSAFKVKEFDSTTTSGIGSLCEMSLAELRERLFILQIDLKEELEDRRVNIKRQRERQQRMVEETKEFVETQRFYRKHKALQPKKEVEVTRDEELECLKQRLQEKREMRKKIIGIHS